MIHEAPVTVAGEQSFSRRDWETQYLHFWEWFDDATQVVLEQVVVERVQVCVHDGVVL